MEGWELSAVEGGGGVSERGEERHGSSWRALLTAPQFPKGHTPQLAGLGRKSCWAARLGGKHGAWPRACAPRALAGGRSVCLGCEVMLL